MEIERPADTSGKRRGRKRKNTGTESNALKKINCNPGVEIENGSLLNGNIFTFEMLPNHHPQSSSSSSSVASVPKRSCLFCLNTVTIKDTDTDPFSLPSMYRNLCNQVMKQNQEEIPSQLSRQMFPFCNTCKNYVEQLWQFQEIIENVQLKIAETISTIQKIVVDAVVLNLDMSNPFTNQTSLFAAGETDQKPFTKLRDAIFKGYQDKLREKKLQAHCPNTIDQNTEADENVDVEFVETQLLSTLETSLNPENEIYPAISIKEEGIHVEISHENDEEVASPLWKNVESRKREGVLAIEGGSFEVYWTSSESEPDMDSLECSKCPQVAFFSTDSEDGMELAYQKIKIHCLLMHSTEVWKNLGSPSSLNPCRLCNVVFKESPERDRHEFMHHKAYEILHGPGLLTTEESVIPDSKKNKQSRKMKL